MSAHGQEEGPSAREHMLTLSFGDDNQDALPRPRTVSIGELEERFRAPDTSRGRLTSAEYHALDKSDLKQKARRDAEKNGEYFIAAQFKGDGRRRVDNVEQLTAFVLDFDSGRTTRTTIEEKLEKLTYLAHTSYSHRPQAERWRAIVFYERPIEPDRHEAIYQHFDRLFGGDLDKSCRKPAQLYYTPACPHDAVREFETIFHEGEIFDPSSIPEQTGDEPGAADGCENADQNGLPVDIDHLRDALAHLDPEPREIWIDVGMAMKHDLGDGGLLIWLEWSKRSRKFEPVKAVETWQSLKPSTGLGAITCASVFYRATQAGWQGQRGTQVPAEIAELNALYFVAPYGRKTVVFRKSRDPLDGSFRFAPIAPPDFRMLLHNRTIATTSGNGKSRPMPLAEHWLSHPQRRQYEGVVLSPGQEVPYHFNLWQGFAVVPKRGSWKRMRRHLLRTICGGDRHRFRYLLNWMAFAVQYPGQPAEVAIVLRGGRGVGKGLLARSFGNLFGPHFLQITQTNHLTGNFNGHLESCVLLFVDEGFWAGDKAGEGVLKGLITEPTLPIERKGLDVVRGRNCLHIIIASNSEWVVPAGPDERRFCVLDVDDACKQDPAYFTPIYDEMNGDGLAAMLHDLQGRDLTRFSIRQVPQTKALGEQKLQSLSPTDKWWLDKLVAGEFKELPGPYSLTSAWGPVPTATVFGDYVHALNRTGVARKSMESELGRRLKKLLPPGEHRIRMMVSGVQVYHYNLPPLEVCRTHFEQLLQLAGRVDWTNGEIID